MTDDQISWQERINTGTAWTRNEQFDKDGYLVIKDLWDPAELYHPVPADLKDFIITLDKNPEHYHHDPVESSG